MSQSVSAVSSQLDVLILEDDELACEWLERLLEADGKGALSVNSLDHAREALKAVSFRLVIIDRKLSDGDGLDLCRDYRERHPEARLSILVLTALDAPEQVEAALSCGADACVSKYCSQEELLARVDQLLAKTARSPRVADGESGGGEAERMRTLRSYAVLDTQAERAFDDITLLASLVCGTPSALISLVDESRQWFKSKVGLVIEQTPREFAFCDHAIREPSGLLVVEDARDDSRFADNPLVTGEPHIRFYAGASLMADGHAIGTLCVIGPQPRQLATREREGLLALSRQVMMLLQQRRMQAALDRASLVKKADDADLKRSEMLFREAFENSAIGIALVSTKGEWLRVNRALCDMLGYDAAELLRTTFQDLTYPEDLAADLGLVRQVLAGEIRNYQMEKRYFHKRGHIVWALLSVSLVRDDHGKPLYFVSQVQDITDRKQTERT